MFEIGRLEDNKKTLDVISYGFLDSMVILECNRKGFNFCTFLISYDSKIKHLFEEFENFPDIKIIGNNILIIDSKKEEKNGD